MTNFLCINKNNKWHAWGKYCFVKPVPIKESYIFKPGGEEPLFGVMKYINQELLDLGVKEGDQVSFVPESEYPFFIDGEKAL